MPNLIFQESCPHTHFSLKLVSRLFSPLFCCASSPAQHMASLFPPQSGNVSGIRILGNAAVLFTLKATNGNKEKIEAPQSPQLTRKTLPNDNKEQRQGHLTQ